MATLPQRRKYVGLWALILVLISPMPLASSELASKEAAPPQVHWRKWNDKLFRDAKETKRYIVLDLNARWCHWCHFMEKRTYAHPDIRRIIDAGYLAVRVDQDANPDLASRYGDWGWPATIIFDPNGKEVAKLQGFQRPSRMLSILYTILAHPERVPKLAQAPDVTPSSKDFLSKEQRQRLVSLLDVTYDKEHAGWGRRLKFMQPEVVEFALEQARTGDAQMKTRVRRTLDAALTLIDPIWGGVYQYSHQRDWSAPHFEKIMASQVSSITLYARAYGQFGDARYLAAAQNIGRYLQKRLRSPEGAFYTSQDADVDHDLLGEDFYKLDDKARRALGRAPPIDTNIYARENGWAVTGLLALHAATGEAKYREAARRTLNWIVANRGLPGAGFSHGAHDRGGPYLSDTLAMGQAMLGFYMSSGEASWLKRAADAADFLAKNFKNTEAGFITTKAPAVGAQSFAKPFVNIEENIRLARFANMLHRTHGGKRFRDLASHAMRYLGSDAVTSQRRFMLGTVLADNELAIEPAHITIVGKPNDRVANTLHHAALALTIGYKRVDRWDPAGGLMPNPDVSYPPMDRAAAFACANQICSLPLFNAKDLTATVAKMMAQRRRRNKL